MSGISQGSLLGLALGDMGNGIECTLSNFADDTKLCGGVIMLEGRNTIHKGLDKLER